MFGRIAAFGMALALISPLAQAAPKASDVPPLVEKLKKHKDPKERAEAARELGRLGSIKSNFTKDAVPALVAALKDPDAGVRHEVAVTLGEIKADPKLAVAPLIEVLKDPDNGVKAAAAESLTYFGTNAKDALPALKEIQASLAKLTKEDQQKNGQLIQTVNEAINQISQAK